MRESKTKPKAMPKAKPVAQAMPGEDDSEEKSVEQPDTGPGVQRSGRAVTSTKWHSDFDKDVPTWSRDSFGLR